MQEKLVYFNREKKQRQEEVIYGDWLVRNLYGTAIGQKVTDLFLTHPLLSKAYGAYQSSFLSKRDIQPFIKAFAIQMDEYEKRNYKSFNDFFVRKFKPNSRKFVTEPNLLPAFAEGRYFGWKKLTSDMTLPIKEENLTAQRLLSESRWEKVFSGGPVLVARLCPVDYHRFHFPDDGETVVAYRIRGDLHSVNPIALKFKNDILVTNERSVSILNTQNFGHLAFVEVGALCVGRIVQTHRGNHFSRGDEKGYFLFGASTVVIMGEPDRWSPDDDILNHTSEGVETFLKLGDRVGYANKRL